MRLFFYLFLVNIFFVNVIPGLVISCFANYGDIIIIGSVSDATTMIPMLTADSSSHEISSWCFNSLVKYDKNLNLIGDLAESWNISSDGLTITFYLRKGVRFHDGRLYTASDSLFNLKFMTDPNTPTPYAGDYLKVAKAEIIDNRIFKVTYKEPFAPGLASWCLPQMPRHLLEGVDIRTSSFNKKPVGTGPYIFKEWLSGSRVILSVFKDYWEGRAYLNQVVYRPIFDMASLFLEIRSGGIDWMELTPLQYRRQTETNFFNKEFRKYRYPASAYTYIGWNLRDERFADIRVRQALSYAINRDELVKGVLLGLGQPATGPLKPGTYYYNSKVKTYPYSPDKARILLNEAGWSIGPNGYLQKAGKPFEFIMLTNQGNQARQNAGVIIQRRLAEIGIKMEIRSVEWAAFIREFVNKGRFEAILLGWTIGQDPDQYDIWHSDNIGVGKLNLIAYKNSEVDFLLNEGRRTFDPVKRKAIYDRWQEILADEVPYTFLYVPDALPIVHSRFQGINPAPAGITYNFINWYVPKQLQKMTLIP